MEFLLIVVLRFDIKSELARRKKKSRNEKKTCETSQSVRGENYFCASKSLHKTCATRECGDLKEVTHNK
jgi:hypothetical protein